jgi:hypothetical protein
MALDAYIAVIKIYLVYRCSPLAYLDIRPAQRPVHIMLGK